MPHSSKFASRISEALVESQEYNHKHATLLFLFLGWFTKVPPVSVFEAVSHHAALADLEFMVESRLAMVLLPLPSRG